MKRKLAILMAAIMTFSIAPTTRSFAADENFLTNSTLTLPIRTAVFEEGILGRNETPRVNIGDIEFVSDGNTLAVGLINGAKAGDTFSVTLDNARWFFRNNEPINSRLTDFNVTDIYIDIDENTSVSALEGFSRRIQGVQRATSNRADEVLSTLNANATYNMDNGVFIARSTGGNDGVYIRGLNAITGEFSGYDDRIVSRSYDPSLDKNEVGPAYLLEVLRTDEFRAEITILQDVENTNSTLYIPLVMRTTSNSDLENVNVTVSNGRRVVRDSTHRVANLVGTGRTNTYVSSVRRARDRFVINKLVVEELRSGALGNSGWFEFVSPNGFYFPSNSVNNVSLFAQTPLAWGNTNVSEGERGVDYSLQVRTAGTGTNERNVLRVNIKNLTQSNSASRLGALVFEGIEIVSEDDTAGFDTDVELRIRNVSGEDAYVTEQSFVIGERVDWDVKLTALDEIPTLFSGQYETQKEFEALDDYHLLSEVRFEEVIEDSWFSARTTVFTLPDGIKIRRVSISDVENIEESSDLEGSYDNTGRRNGYVTVDGNQIRLHNLTTERRSSNDTSTDDNNFKAALTLKIWASIEPGFEGDITVELDGTAIVDSQDISVIAGRAINPVEIKTEITEVETGFQTTATADITLTETKAGALRSGKDVELYLTDFISSDMYFAENPVIEVIDGDIDIVSFNRRGTADSHLLTSLLGIRNNTTGSSLFGSPLSFEIRRASSKPSTIKISGIEVKVSRNVPESNGRPYQIVVLGTAVAENLYYDHRDTFVSTQLVAPYLTVVTPGQDIPTVVVPQEPDTPFSAEVRVTNNQTTFYVNSTPYEMDIAPYISLASDSMMVPIRFISNAFGIPDTNITWDDINRTATIRSVDNNLIIQFKAGSDQVRINGVDMPMVNEMGERVFSEMSGPDNMNSRMFIPFRQIGKIFNVPVSFDESTSTAIYNERTSMTPYDNGSDTIEDTVIIEVEEIEEVE